MKQIVVTVPDEIADAVQHFIIENISGGYMKDCISMCHPEYDGELPSSESVDMVNLEDKNENIKDAVNRFPSQEDVEVMADKNPLVDPYDSYMDGAFDCMMFIKKNLGIHE